ncbi:uncharacterized protein LOC127279982 isoform X2 [Leptopilina boulardi]|uniref:uncharacterized protein LOC127279982 isoform X2 n=1 Tax=Leptopilina boulardi TaxID=63433 RepID=UPI0021F50014|nr:uncharacterized protein LOC127279982 isoform X2 [Leptopilina boulardi]
MPQPSQERREQVESIIRAILIAHKEDVTIQQLRSDYLEYEGEDIPYREFNYNSLIDFLESLTNVVKFITKFNQKYMKAVDTERTRHLSALVAGQKKKRKPIRKSKRTFRGGYVQGFCGLHSTRWNSGSFQSSHSSRFNNSYSSPSRINNTSSTASRFDYSYSSPSRVNNSSASRLENSSASLNVDKQVPVMSENNCQTELKEPSVVQYFTGEDCTEKNYLSDYDDYDDNDDFSYISISSPSPEFEQKTSGKPLIRFVEQSCEKFNKEKKNTGLSSDAFENDVQCSMNHKEKYSPNKLNSSYQNIQENCHEQKYSKLNSSNQNIQENCHEQKYSPNKLNSSKQNIEENCHKESMNHEKYYSDDIYNNEASCNGINSNGYDIQDENYIEFNESNIEINPRVKDRLRIIIRNHPNGIWCADLPKIYHQESGLNLEYEELGFTSVVAFASQLTDIFHCVRPKPKGDYKLYNVQKPLPDINNQEINNRSQYSSAEQYRIYVGDDPEAIPSRLDPSVTDRLFPDGVMLLNERVGQIFVSELCVEKDYEEVILSEVFNPSFFWIQLRKRQPKFKKFMSQLHEFYQDEYYKYLIPVIILDKGLNVACVYAKKWHRGIIKAVLPDGSSLVHFYDYGTIKSYKPKSLYYLHRRFSNLPAQAIPCGLYNVRPFNSDKWHMGITWKFIENTSCPLIAQIVVRNEEENSALITLTDTQKDDDFHLNDWLIDAKFAVHGQMNIDFKNLSDYEESKLPKKYDFPDEELLSFIKSQESKEVNSTRPPPGFQSLHSITEESTKSNDPVNNNNNSVGNDLSQLEQQFMNMYIKIQSQMNPEASTALAQRIVNNLSNSHDSSIIVSKILDKNDCLNSTQQQVVSKFPISVEELFRQVPKFNENIENQENIQKLLKEPKNSRQNSTTNNHNDLENREILNYKEKLIKELSDYLKPEYQNLQPENLEFLKNLNKEINQRESLKKNSILLNSQTPEKIETNPFKTAEFNKKISTNPFLNDFNSTNSPKQIKSSRINLKDFLDNPYDSMTNINETKNEYLNKSIDSCQSNSDIFLFSDKKDENKNSNFPNKTESIPINNFSPVIDLCTNQVNSGAKIFYESGPIMYNQNGTDEKTDNLEKNNWKTIPSIETSGTSESVMKTGFSFKINKPKNPSERANCQNKMKISFEKARQNISNIGNNIPNPLIEKKNSSTLPINVAVNQNYQKSSTEIDLLSAATFPLPSSTESSRAPTPVFVKENKFNEMPIRNSNNKLSNDTSRDKGNNIPNGNLSDNLQKIISHNTNPFVGDQNYVNFSSKSIINDKLPANAEMINPLTIPSDLNVDTNFKPLEKSSVCYTYPITTKKMRLIVLNVDDEGWLISDEFVEAFTNLNGPSIMLRALNMVNVQIPFKTVDRYSHPLLLADLDITPLNVIRNVENKIVRPVHLTPLKLAPKILSSLNIINRFELHLIIHENKLSTNTVINDIIKLISSYKTYMTTKNKARNVR